MSSLQRLKAILLALTLPILTACSDDNAEDPALGLVIATTEGPVIGQFSDRGETWEWLGIPFAEAPVGERRWRAPEEPADRRTPLRADAFAPACPQDNFFGAPIGEEDCLYLNIWRPRSNERDLPVMVWIHGGGNNSGAASEGLYHGARLAERANIVVVTVQYRLGALGWLRVPALRTGDSEDDSGNFGTLDLIQALTWVQDNIRSFGGDPNRVTVAGESAGGANILTLMLSPLATGLFDQAIVQSAGGAVTAPVAAEALAEDWIAALEAQPDVPPAPEDPTALAVWLRERSVAQLLAVEVGVGALFGDGAVIPAEGYAQFATGDFPGKVPLLIGANQDEYKLYTNPLGFNVLPDASPALRAAVGRYVSDAWRVTATDRLATQLRALPDFPDIYAYRFRWGSPDEDGNSPLPLGFGASGGAHHAAEIPFMFGNEDRFILEDFTSLIYTEANAASRASMADIMVGYWGGFIRDGYPVADGLPVWAPWQNSPGAPRAQTLDVRFADNSPAIGVDTSVWTPEDVYAAAEAALSPELYAEVTPFLDQWFARFITP